MAYPGFVLKMACFQSQSHWLMNCLNPIDIDRHRQAHRGINLFLPVVWLLNRATTVISAFLFCVSYLRG